MIKPLASEPLHERHPNLPHPPVLTPSHCQSKPMAASLNTTILTLTATSTISNTNTMATPKRIIENWSDLIYRNHFETDSIDKHNSCEFFSTHWKLSLYCSAVYIMLIWWGQRWMRHREAFQLRIPLAVWSGALSVFSLYGSVALWPEFISVIRQKGIVGSYLDNSYADEFLGVYWFTMFSLSKIAELIDTGFIVLRKQKLIFLHWIHHILTLVFVFYVYSDVQGVARWMTNMNFAVHTAMYGYFALRAMRIQIPRFFAMSITVAQIVQMIAGLGAHTHLMVLFLTGQNSVWDIPNGNTFRSTFPGFLMYLLYFYLFVKFFIDSYLRPTLKATTQNGKAGPPKSDANNNSLVASNHTKLE